jgi:hypothetical protein
MTADCRPFGQKASLADGERAGVAAELVDAAGDDRIEVEEDDAVSLVEEARLEEGQFRPPAGKVMRKRTSLNTFIEARRIIREADKLPLESFRQVPANHVEEDVRVVGAESCPRLDADDVKHYADVIANHWVVLWHLYSVHFCVSCENAALTVPSPVPATEIAALVGG